MAKMKKQKTKRSKKSLKSYEKPNISHHKYACLKYQAYHSPVQDKARSVIRKYKLQMKQLEFKKLQKLIPNMNEIQEPTEVSTILKCILHRPTQFL